MADPIRCLVVVGSYAGSPTGYQVQVNDLLAYADYAGREEIAFEVVPLSVVDDGLPSETTHDIHYRDGPRHLRLIGALQSIIERRSDVHLVHLTTLPWYTLPLLGASAGKPLVLGPNIGSNKTLSAYDSTTRRMIQTVSPDAVRRHELYGDRLERLKFAVSRTRPFRPVRYLDFSQWAAATGLHARGVPADAISVLPHGVRRDVFYPPNAPKSNRSDSLSVVIPKDRARIKGFDVVVEAIDRLDDALDGVTVTVIGSDSPPDEPWADSAVVRDRFEFVGRIQRAEMRAHYLRSDAHLFPSYTESAGNPMYESLACGVPVIATDGDVFRENACDGNTLFFQRGDPATLATQIERFYDEPERYWEAAYRTSSQYDIERTFDALLEEYRSLLE